MEAAFSQLTGAEVEARLDLAGIGYGRMNDMAALWAHPQLKARDRWRDVDTPAGPIAALLPPGSWQHSAPRMDAVPALGQHTDAILATQGYSAEQIAGLRASGVV